MKVFNPADLRVSITIAENPNDRLDHILEIGDDALQFEESKKDFFIDIDRIAARLDGRCVLFGNIDAIRIL